MVFVKYDINQNQSVSEYSATKEWEGTYTNIAGSLHIWYSHYHGLIMLAESVHYYGETISSVEFWYNTIWECTYDANSVFVENQL